MDGVVDISSDILIHGESAEQDVDKNQSVQQTNGHNENGAVSNDPCSECSANLVESRKENNVEDANANIENTKMDGLQELPTLAEEFESELPRKSEGEVEVTLIANGGSNQTGDMAVEQEQQSNVFLEADDVSKPRQTENNPMATEGIGMVSNPLSTRLRSKKVNSTVPENGRTAESQNQKLRTSQKSSTLLKGNPKATTRNSIDTNSKSKKNAGEVCEADKAEITLPALNNPLRRSVNHGSARSNYTVPQPFALATDKRAFTGVRPADNEIVDSKDKRTVANSITSSSVSKKPQLVVKMASTQSSSKSLRSESLKVHDQSIKVPIQVDPKNDEEEDTCSVDSSTATPTQALKEGPSNGASGVSFSFRCDERAEKRKAFYSKLEEKIHAKELEKNQLQAKSKEEQEAEIKRLRKSLTFKATPMPEFYQETTPPKVEIKKIPPTRAKSPKLGRRNSSKEARFSVDQNKSTGALQELTEDENLEKGYVKDIASSKKDLRRSLSKTPYAQKTLKSNFDEMSLKQQTVDQPKIKSAVGSTENGNLTTVRVQNTSSSACNEDKVILKEFEPIKEKANAEPLQIDDEIASIMVIDNQPSEPDEGRVIVQEYEVVEEKDVTEPLNGYNEIVEVEFANINQPRESDEERIDEQGLEAVKEKNSAEPLNGHDEIAEVKENNDQLRDSDPLVHTVKAAETGCMELVDKSRDSHASKSKNNGSKVPLRSKSQKIEQIPCNGADANGIKAKLSRSSQQGSTQESFESNGKGIQKSGRERFKAMTPSLTSSNRESVKSTSSKRTNKGSNDMARVVGDVAVQS